jgi:hypothetical protein
VVGFGFGGGFAFRCRVAEVDVVGVHGLERPCPSNLLRLETTYSSMVSNMIEHLDAAWP